jgi:adenine phosphoribosyltransferase
MQAEKLRSLIRTIPDHPKPGIQFRDITTLLRDPIGLREAVERIAEPHLDGGIAAVVGIEARGFTFGTAVAYHLGCGFVPLRKPGKLPGETIGRSFELEYGRDRIELHVGSVEPNQRVLLVDDLIATGGTAEAAVDLLREVGAQVVECAFVVALPELGGVARLERAGCAVRWLCEFSGH